MSTKRRHAAGSLLALAAASVVLAVVGWLVFFGWHEENDPGGWQVIGLSTTLGLLAVFAGWRGWADGLLVLLTVTATLVLVCIREGSTAPPTPDANMYEVGALLLAIVTPIGLSVAVLLGGLLREHQQRAATEAPQIP